jgi:hypothetical protein
MSVEIVHAPGYGPPLPRHSLAEMFRSASTSTYRQKSTHLSCAGIYSAKNNRLDHPRHNAYFSIRDGSVLPPLDEP